ncbi:MAG: long-chain-fatty-acid--CoA ligase [Chloroflexi bacterium]|nr:long-chain-fatty-acid--CoA ligase [Chloroflexota bacterium]
MNVAELLTISSSVVPEREALVFEGKRIAFERLAERSNRLAKAFQGLGVGMGHRVAVIQVNCGEHVEACFATAKADGVYVPLNFRAKADELAFMINDSEPSVLLVGKRYVDVVRSIRPQLKSVKHLVALEEPVKGWVFYDELLEKSGAEEVFPSRGDEDLFMLMFTAGTTGSPKGVMLTHNSFTSYILANVEPADPTIEEKNILTVPLYHIAGIQAVMAAIYGGRTLIVQRQFEAEDWMKLVQEERANRAMMVPTMLKQIMDHPSFHQYDLSSLQVITYGAAPMPLEVIKRAIKEFPGTRFINAFGQTETASTITMLPSEDHLLEGSPEEVERKLKRLTSIGKPLPDVEVKIVTEEGKEAAVGEVGEIVAKGLRLMKGYWKREEATRETFRDGWLYTGDLGYTDEDGYIFLSGRAKDFIKRGGEMISPEEVEQVLMSHPAVDEAAVIGVPDVDWGERVRAIVVLKSGQMVREEELIEYCRQRLASFKKPESVVFAEELPRNPMGKVLKRVLREQYGQPVQSKA